MFKRILYTSFVDLSLPYGPGVNELGFLKDLLRRYGDNLHVVLPKPIKGLPRELAGVNCTYMTLGGSSREWFGWLQARTIGAFALWKAIGRFAPDLIVTRSGTVAMPQLLISLQKKIPYVVKTGGSGSHSSFYKRNILSRSLKFLDQPVQKLIMENAACIDVVSESHRANLAQLYPAIGNRIHVVDNGVDIEIFASADAAESRAKLGFASDDIVIGYVGNFPLSRGGKEVIDVVAALHSKLPVRGLIVGDSGQAESCRNYAAELGVGDRVVVYGQADFTLVPALIAALDCGLSILRPAERGASEQKVRQYLASSVCVVGTAGSNDFLRGFEFARVVESEQPEEIVAAVLSLISQGPGKVAELGRDAHDYATSTLTISARNDSRLQYWAEHVRGDHSSKAT